MIIYALINNGFSLRQRRLRLHCQCVRRKLVQELLHVLRENGVHLARRMDEVRPDPTARHLQVSRPEAELHRVLVDLVEDVPGRVHEQRDVRVLRDEFCGAFVEVFVPIKVSPDDIWVRLVLGRDLSYIAFRICSRSS